MWSMNWTMLLNLVLLSNTTFTNWECWEWEQYVNVILPVRQWLKETPKFKYIQNTLSKYLFFDILNVKLFIINIEFRRARKGVDAHLHGASNVPDMKTEFRCFNLSLIAWLLADQLRNCLPMCKFVVCSIWQLAIGLKWNSLNWGESFN